MGGSKVAGWRVTSSSLAGAGNGAGGWLCSVGNLDSTFGAGMKVGGGGPCSSQIVAL